MSRFDTLLVANRGEIALRIIRTARRMGLRTVAVFSDADRGAPHVAAADEALRLGPAPAQESYLDADAVLKAALRTGAGAVHPGYGFLSENADFARSCEAAGIIFVGPTPQQLEIFGAKHTARDAAEAAGVPLMPGTGLLESLEEAVAEASRIGYPVMLKATAGGGGIGMRACHTEEELRRAWDEVLRLAGASFSSAGVFLERLVTGARHVEVQVFGDGEGNAVTLGDRDCTLQRRHQKVIEESPAPSLPDEIRASMSEAARNLCQSLSYRSAGTVEYIYDADRDEASFLEVNTRLQVEHPVTEARYGIDLVEWMLRLAQGEQEVLETLPEPAGAAVEARVYAENPDLGHVPDAGTVTRARFPAEADGSPVRIDGWIEDGTDVSAQYDPMLAKVIVSGEDRETAWSRLRRALADSRVDGIATNLGLLRSIAEDETVREVRHSTASLETITDRSPRLQVLSAGLLSTVQDLPGRTGYWPVGIPPSGPMDRLSFALGNAALGNPENAPGMEITMTGPRLRFHVETEVMVTGAPTPVSVDGVPEPQWEPVTVPAGAELEIGTAERGMRSYLLVAGGLDLPRVMGSASTFDLGRIGGHAGRALTVGDVIGISEPASPRSAHPVPPESRPDFPTTWRIAALEGPHAAPEFFTDSDMETFFSTGWEVHFNSSRTGVRLLGPRPEWARSDGGEAGLHPSNIHDTPYAVGTVDYTGDLPILLGPDGPSLGGFTCPATTATGHLWKLGQLRPGDTVEFVPVTEIQAALLLDHPLAEAEADRRAVTDGGILHHIPETPATPALTMRRSGDANLLIEYGEQALELASRMRVHALMEALEAAELPGVVELTPGIRSLQVHIDPRTVTLAETVETVRQIEDQLPATGDLEVPSRTVHLPLSWDDPATREAIRRYMNGVRDDAPWCPWNIEFIRRINGLESVEEVCRTVFEAEYLVMGLGDVYLGAPVATPIDPRHRLVTTKYNPARTWTPQNAVGIGGAYMCIYGMEGPGGYQFVGRTVPIWSTLKQPEPYEPGVPWLLRFFDRISWYPVEPEELLELRAEMEAGRHVPHIEEGTFRMAEYDAFIQKNAGSIAEFRERQSQAFAQERQAWEASGEFDRQKQEIEAPAQEEVAVPEGCVAVEAPFVANVFRIDVAEGDLVQAGGTLLALEAMKMEAPLVTPVSGRIHRIAVGLGDQVGAGSVLVVIDPSPSRSEDSGDDPGSAADMAEPEQVSIDA